ncbi:ABC transporter substrate-binding protein [Butyrivibrio sp. JL13D10]|uniref:ABC transporter substrate-binding protein n=1 Tax=Butyrivibrio sp. JL13D10 TaxID=3236815 RepID=UPI0038B4BFCC
MKIVKRRTEFVIAAFLVILFTLSMAGCGSISDGEYAASVSLMGGSGKAHIESPCRVVVKNNKAEADIVWSSSNYDYMIVGGKTYYPVNSEGNSEFIIPIEFDKDMSVQADTTAMSQAHLIDYSLRFSIEKSSGKDTLDSDSDDTAQDKIDSDKLNSDEHPADRLKSLKSAPDIDGLRYISTDENEYAKCFAIHRYSEGYACICLDDDRKYLIVPGDKGIPKDLDEDIVVLHKPFNNIYLAASGVMCHFDTIGQTEKIVLSGLTKDKWYIDSARKAMETGSMEYGGKYSAPDYEKIIMKDIDLTIENTMILHAPKVLEKLQDLGIQVFIDRSSYEESPLGRLEWIKIYGFFTDREEEAHKAFEEQTGIVKALDDSQASGKTVAVFSINSNHLVITKKQNDYLARMIEMAGAIYLGPKDNDDDSSSTQETISIESFYDYASEADIVLYNATIEDVPDSIGDLMSMDATFNDFKAFNKGDVYYIDKSLYQFAGESGTIIDNLRSIFNGKSEDTKFIHKLRW